MKILILGLQLAKQVINEVRVIRHSPFVQGTSNVGWCNLNLNSFIGFLRCIPITPNLAAVHQVFRRFYFNHYWYPSCLWAMFPWIKANNNREDAPIGDCCYCCTRLLLCTSLKQNDIVLWPTVWSCASFKHETAAEIDRFSFRHTSRYSSFRSSYNFDSRELIANMCWRLWEGLRLSSEDCSRGAKK
jgi:hypothetical protein